MTKNQGFTLIELMVTVAIVGILAAIAYPTYTEQVRKARRADAQSALTALSVALERHYTEGTPSTYGGAAAGGADTGAPAIFATETPLDSSVKYYNLTIHASTATSYEVRAAPKNAQVNDKCGTLTLNSRGQRDITGAASGVTKTTCWK